MIKHISGEKQRRRNIRCGGVRFCGAFVKAVGVSQIVRQRNGAHRLQAEGYYSQTVNVRIGHFYYAAYKIVLCLLFLARAERGVHYKQQLVFRIVHLVAEGHAGQHENTQNQSGQMQHDGGYSVSVFSEPFGQLKVWQERKNNCRHNKQQKPSGGKIYFKIKHCSLLTVLPASAAPTPKT